MRSKRIRRWIGWFFLLAVSLIAASTQAQDYPIKPIEVIVGYPPGEERT